MTDEAFDRGIDRWLRDRVAGVAPCAAAYQEGEGMELGSMTTGEAEAYRQGFADGVAAAPLPLHQPEPVDPYTAHRAQRRAMRHYACDPAAAKVEQLA